MVIETRAPQRPASRIRWRATGQSEEGERATPEEIAIAIVHDGSTTAVMMATPTDVDDLAVGFSLTEGVVTGIDQIRTVEIVTTPLGIEARLWLEASRSRRQAARRRRLAGPTGCGLCGIESLEEANRPPHPVASDASFSPEEILSAMAALERSTPLGRATRATHAAAMWRPGQPLLVREDVGRHNALDKVIGAAAKGGIDVRDGLLLLTSRISVELVQKAASAGISTVCAVSAPTALAIAVAEASAMTLIGIARHDGFEVFSHPDRVFRGEPTIASSKA